MAHLSVSRRAVAQLIAKKLVEQPSEREQWLAMAAAYLVSKGQTDRAGQLVQDIVREYFVLTGELAVSVASAHPLNDELRTGIAAMLQQATGAKKVAISETVDKTLLSGYRVKTPDYEMTTTAQDRLRKLRSLEV